MYSKLKRLVIALMVIAVFPVVLISVFAIQSLNRGSEPFYESESAYDLSRTVAEMRILIAKSKLSVKDFHNLDNQEEMDAALGSFTSYMNAFEDLANKLAAFGFYDELIGRADGIASVARDYKNEHISIMMSNRKLNRGELAQIEPMAQVLEESLAEVQDYLQMLAYEYEAQYARQNAGNTFTLIILSVLAVCIALVIGIVALKDLHKADEEEQAGIDMRTYNPIKSTPTQGYDANSLLAELSSQISELKAVAYDLSRFSKDKGSK